MELPLLPAPSFPKAGNAVLPETIEVLRHKILTTSSSSGYPPNLNSLRRGRKSFFVLSALPETAASIVVAAIVVGTAASVLVRTTKASDSITSPFQVCEDCGGSGICSQCNGEGFVLKKLSEASAEKARLTAKNMATRYTAGLPKKWSYCSKCSSARSCSTCKGTGKIIL